MSQSVTVVLESVFGASGSKRRLVRDLRKQFGCWIASTRAAENHSSRIYACDLLRRRACIEGSLSRPRDQARAAGMNRQSLKNLVPKSFHWRAVVKVWQYTTGEIFHRTACKVGWEGSRIIISEGESTLMKADGWEDAADIFIHGSRMAITVPIGKWALRVFKSARKGPGKLYRETNITSPFGSSTFSCNATRRTVMVHKINIKVIIFACCEYGAANKISPLTTSFNKTYCKDIIVNTHRMYLVCKHVSQRNLEA